MTNQWRGIFHCILSAGQKPGFGGRGVPPAYNVLTGETPAPQSDFENLDTDPCGV